MQRKNKCRFHHSNQSKEKPPEDKYHLKSLPWWKLSIEAISDPLTAVKNDRDRYLQSDQQSHLQNTNIQEKGTSSASLERKATFPTVNNTRKEHTRDRKEIPFLIPKNSNKQESK